MGLIEVLGRGDHIENGGSVFEQTGCVSRALDLAKGCVGDAGGPQKVALLRALG